MQRRGFTLLLGATIVSVIAAIVAVRTEPDYVTTAPPGERALPELAAKLDRVAIVHLVHDGTRIDLSRASGRWVVTDKGNYPADAGRVRRLLLALANLTLVEPKTRLPALYPRLDVGNPKDGTSTGITIEDNVGRTVGALIVGKSRPDRLGLGNDGTYVRRVGEARSWLARGSVAAIGDALDWLDRPILDVPAGRIDTMVFKGARHGVLVIGRNAMTAKFAVDDAADGASFKDDAAIAAPAGALEALALDDVRPAAALPVPDDVATAAYQTFDGLVVRLRLFRHGKRDWVAITASGNGRTAAEGKALNARVGHWVYAIPPDRIKLLRTRLTDLIAPAKGS